MKWRENSRGNYGRRFMPLALFCCFFLSVLSVTGMPEGIAQEVVSGNFQNEPLKDVLKELKHQTGVYFMYNTSEIDAEVRVSVKLERENLETALNKILSGLPYTYRRMNDYFLIIPERTPARDTVKKSVTVKGVVLDEKKMPLPGVTVRIKGSSIGTVTDVMGEFKIDLPELKDVMLIFSFIGMETLELKADTVMNIVMKEESQAVDEVVVTGYQQIDKRVLSSSVISVKGSDIIEASAISIDKMLQGRLAGVAVLSQTSTPGAAPKIRIRGSSSITGNREPVWVVDGMILDDPVAISAEELNSLDNVNLIGNAIAGINPSDIERIDILKDASATAIYGVKAANGVIVVTTKKGRKGQARISYSGSLSTTIRPSYDDMHLMNSKERIEVSEEMHVRGLQFSSYMPTNMGYEGALQELWNKEISHEQFLQKVKELKEVNTDWYDILFRTSISNQHSLSVSGATDKTNYYFSLGYANEQGVVRGEEVTRYTALIKSSVRVRDNLQLGFKMNGALNYTKRPHTSIDLYEYAYQTSRAIPAYNADGSLFYYANAFGFTENLMFNVLNELDESGTKITNHSLAVNLNIDWTIIPSLKFSSLIGVSLNDNYQTYWASARSFYIAKMRGTPYGAPLPEGGLGSYRDQVLVPSGGELINDDTRNLRYTVRNSFSYLQRWGVHEVSAIVGSEISSSQYNAVQTKQWGYMPERGLTFAPIDQSEFPAYAKMVRDNPDKITDNLTNIVSWYGAFTYAYDNRYILNFNVRTDGSNKFGQDKSVRFLPVWSVSSRWNLHEERFVSGSSWLNEFALRASYGIQGNVHPDQTPNLIVKLGSVDDISGELISTLYKLPNNKLKWEKTKSWNLGLDITLFDGRFGGTVEVYRKKGVDQVVNKLVVPSSGADYVAINKGNLENKGWELTVNMLPVRTSNWTWYLSFNTSKNYDKVTDAGDSEDVSWSEYVNGTLIRNGRAVNSFYSYRFKGLNENGLPTFYGESEKDEEGNVLVNSQQEAYDQAFVYSGRREPNFTGGIRTDIKFKQISLGAIFSVALGNKVRLNDLYLSSGQTLPFPQQNMSDEFVDRWRKPGDEKLTNVPALSDDALAFGAYERKYPIADNRWDMYNKSDIRVKNGNFLRCRSLTLRYDIVSKWLEKIGCQSANFGIEASNLFVIKSKGLKGRDPEQITMGSRTVPPQRGFSCSLNVVF